MGRIMRRKIRILFLKWASTFKIFLRKWEEKGREVFMTHSPCSFFTQVFMFTFLNSVKDKSFFPWEFVNILFTVNTGIWALLEVGDTWKFCTVCHWILHRGRIHKVHFLFLNLDSEQSFNLQECFYFFFPHIFNLFSLLDRKLWAAPGLSSTQLCSICVPL